MRLAREHLIVPEWPAPATVHALQTTRHGGFSLPPFDSLNLGTHVGDNAWTVAANRQQLNAYVPAEPVWLEQVHGTEVVIAEQSGCVPRADACVARKAHAVCVVMTADCLPVLFCDDAGTVVGAAHAGWRGLAEGVLEATIAAMQVPGARIMAWLGPAIGPQAFEVGEEVRERFLAQDARAEFAFTPKAGKYLADLYLLARQRLDALGVYRVYGGDFCTWTESERFYSYRRDGQTGRMASLVWLSPA